MAQVRDTSPYGTDFPNYCQAAEWGAESPLLAACAAGAVAVVALGLATSQFYSAWSLQQVVSRQVCATSRELDLQLVFRDSRPVLRLWLTMLYGL